MQFDFDGRVLWHNAAARELLGQEVQLGTALTELFEALGRPLDVLIADGITNEKGRREIVRLRRCQPGRAGRGVNRPRRSGHARRARSLAGAAMNARKSDRLVSGERTRPRGFIDWKPRAETEALLDDVRIVLETYKAQLPLMVRQIYYRLVASFDYEKTDRFSDRLGEALIPPLRRSIFCDGQIYGASIKTTRLHRSRTWNPL